jgi:outer membrane protein OmpA-like peptidoglycan-associated protein
MKSRFLISAGVALATMLGVAEAQAQWLVGPTGPAVWYAGPEGGWTNLEDQRLTGPAGVSTTQHFDDGFNVGARLGAEFGWWRFEEEYRFQQNKTTSEFGIPVNGNRTAHAIMTNAIYDFGGWGWPFTPHIGGGIGVMIQHDGSSTKGTPLIVGVTPGGVPIGYNGNLTHGSSTNFAYQGIAGIRYNINPSLAFDLDYRYLASDDPTFRLTPTNTSVKSGYGSHNLVASLTMRFGPTPAVAAPIPPAPPPVQRRVFLVFFDWDRDTITPDGLAIINQAAAAWRSGAPVQIMVTGYTDASGSAGYNQRLSERRANNVANALGRTGVPRQAMVVSGRGKNDQRVPTADGVREPQNRRVEIVFP